LDIIREQEHAMVDSIVNGNETIVQQERGGVKIVARRLRQDDFVNGSTDVVVAVEGSTASVSVPLPLLEELGDDAVLVFSVFSEALPFRGDDSRGQGEDRLRMQAGLDVNIALGSTGVFQNVSNLTTPMLITLPAVPSSDVRCAYWDEVAERWSIDGLTEGVDSEGNLVCATTHLTFFAAIASGFVKSFRCTPLQTLWSREAYVQLWKGTWWQEIPAVLFFMALWLLLSVFLWAIRTDIRRSRPVWREFVWRNLAWRERTNKELVWHDAFFLIPQGASQEELQEGEKGWTCWGIRDVCDEVAESFNQVWFRFIRTFCETMRDGCADVRRRVNEREDEQTLSWKFLDEMLRHNSRRQACAKQRLRTDDAKFMLKQVDNMKSGNAVITDTTPTHHRQNLGKMSHSVKKDMHKQYAEHGTWYRFPTMVGRDLRSFNPLSQILLRSIFMKSSMQALSFITHVLGACTVCTALLSVSTFNHGRRSRPDEDCEPEGFWEIFGRMLSVTVFAALLAALPALILKSLHQRNFKIVDHVGGPKWTRQLSRWRCQDVIFWIAGISWVSLCILANILFLANVSTEALGAWLADMGMEFVEIVLLIPLAVAVASLLILMLFLAAMARRRGIRKDDMVKRVQKGLKLRPLEVTVVGCKGLRNADWTGSSDPYCVCQIQGEEEPLFQTRVMWNTLDPVWDETEKLSFYALGESLVFKVYDHDQLNLDDFLGEVVLEASTLEAAANGNGDCPGTFDGELPLLNAGMDVPPTIHIRAVFEALPELPVRQPNVQTVPSDLLSRGPSIHALPLPVSTIPSSRPAPGQAAELATSPEVSQPLRPGALLLLGPDVIRL
jgi:hypothetical protein